jgi:hypothetical protein
MNVYKPISLLKRNFNTSQKTTALSLAIFLIFFIGFRPINGAFDDMGVYDEYYQVLLGTRFYFDWDADNIIFDNLFNFLASNYVPIELFFFIICAIDFGFLYLACVKMFPNDTLLAFVVYLAGFITFANATNGIKGGAASSAFLVALAYRNNKPLSIFLFLISFGLHHSMKLPICAYIVTLYAMKRKTDKKYYLYFWFFCFAMAALHITYFQSILAGQTDAQGAKYLTAKGEDLVVSGFRPDFVLYSVIPIFLGYYIEKTYKLNSKFFNYLWCTYTLSNAMWLLCTYAAYTNRIAALSWFMYPLLLIYPFVLYKKNLLFNHFLNYTVYGHLAFFLFMNIIYY